VKMYYQCFCWFVAHYWSARKISTECLWREQAKWVGRNCKTAEGSHK